MWQNITQLKLKECPGWSRRGRHLYLDWIWEEKGEVKRPEPQFGLKQAQVYVSWISQWNIKAIQHQAQSYREDLLLNVWTKVPTGPVLYLLFFPPTRIKIFTNSIFLSHSLSTVSKKMLGSPCLTEVYSRGVDGCAVHQRGIVVIFDKVSLLCFSVTALWLVDHCDLSAVWRVVEVDDVNIKHQDSWSRDLSAWGQHTSTQKL